MEKFTKGEWKASCNSISCKGRGYIAKALPAYMDWTEVMANAHLIAAAPEIYYELKNLLHDSMHYEDYERIEKLLAKARGEK